MSNLQWQKSLVRLVIDGNPGWFHLNISGDTWKFRRFQSSPPALLPVNSAWGAGQNNVGHVIELPADVQVSKQIPMGDAFSLAKLTNPGIDPATWPTWSELVAFHENRFEASGQNEAAETQANLVASTTGNPSEHKPGKGSQHCLRTFVNERSDELDAAIVCSSISLSSFATQKIEWISPLAKDGYKEYQDDFLEQLRLVEHQPKLQEFWPAFGPVWDGLAVVRGLDGRVGILLVEAKAHPEESLSTCGAKAVTSLSKIQQSFVRTQAYMGIGPQEWTSPYYQLANRLAFTYFMNELVRVPTWFVLVNFVNDGSHKPTSLAAWRAYQPQMFRTLGITPECRMLDRIITVYPDCDTMTAN